MSKRSNLDMPIKTLRAIAEAIGLDPDAQWIVAIDIHADCKDVAKVAVTLRMDVDGRGKLCDVMKRFRLTEDDVAIEAESESSPYVYKADGVEIEIGQMKSVQLHGGPSDGQAGSLYKGIDRITAGPNSEHEYRFSGHTVNGFERWDYVEPVKVEPPKTTGARLAAAEDAGRNLAFTAEHDRANLAAILGTPAKAFVTLVTRVVPATTPPAEKDEMERFFFEK